MSSKPEDRKVQLVKQLQENQSTFVVFDAVEFENEWLLRKGKIQAPSQAGKDFTIRDQTKDIIGHAITAKDTGKFVVIAADMGLDGQVQIVTYNKKSYVVYKHLASPKSFAASAKTLFSNFRFIPKDPKIVQMAVGNAEALKGAVKGGVITAVLFTGVNVLDYILNDKATLANLIGTTASDLTKISAGAIVGTAAHALTSLAMTSMGVTSAAPLVLGPIGVSIMVGIGIGILLNTIDKEYGLTESLIKALEKYLSEESEFTREMKQGFRYLNNHPADGFGRLFGIPSF